MMNRESERVLQLSADGDGVDFIRHWNEHRAWRFNYRILPSAAGSSKRDFGRTPYDPNHPHDFLTLGDAIHACSPDGAWISWSVLEIHPDYREQLWQLREDTIEMARDGDRKMARQQDSQWAKACGHPGTKLHPGPTGQLRESSITPGSVLDMILGASLAVIEQVRNVPMSDEEAGEFEAKLIRSLEQRKADRLGTS